MRKMWETQRRLDSCENENENEVQHRAGRRQGKGGNENEKAPEKGRKEVTGTLHEVSRPCSIP